MKKSAFSLIRAEPLQPSPPPFPSPLPLVALVVLLGDDIIATLIRRRNLPTTCLIKGPIVSHEMQTETPQTPSLLHSMSFRKVVSLSLMISVRLQQQFNMIEELRIIKIQPKKLR